jgi:hypothetical protein
VGPSNAPNELTEKLAAIARYPIGVMALLWKAPHNRKRPSGEEGRFWGYYREERYMYLYICGSVGGR